MLYKKTFLLLTLIVLLVAGSFMSFNKKKSETSIAVELIGQLYQKEVMRFDSCLQQYPRYFYDSSYALRKAKFGELVCQFKKIEGFYVYFNPKQAYETFIKTAQFEARDFGPPFPDNWLWTGPFGIDPDSVIAKWSADEISFSKKFIERSVTNFRKIIKETDVASYTARMTDADVFEALRLQMIRISTIGLANGDFIVEATGMPSLQGAFSAWCDGIRVLTGSLPDGRNTFKSTLLHKMKEGEESLQTVKDFNSFDRMAFLTRYLIPLAHHLNELQRMLQVEPVTRLAAFNSNAGSIYDPNAFNVDFFAPGEEAYLTKAKAELGKLLFFDPILSSNNERACASCHKPELAFTDGNVKSLNFERGDLPRNAPTVINAAFQKAQFWDLRSGSLEDQLDSVINSTDELHSSFEDVISKIYASEEYKKLFYTAFPETKNGRIERKHVKIAIASYERELTGLNSRFDQYVRGDKTKLNDSEIAGFNIYMGKAKCGSCHYAPLFAGALPPYFEFTDHRSIGVPLKDSMKVYEVDLDTGASKVFKNPFLHFSFKVPTVRNVALTAPYMHNGVFKTLEQVVDFYEDAGGVKFENDMRPGMKGLPFFMILPEKLNLSNEEKVNLIAFMKALTDTSSAKNIPDRLPKIGNPFARLNKRKVGGTY